MSATNVAAAGVLAIGHANGLLRAGYASVLSSWPGAIDAEAGDVASLVELAADPRVAVVVCSEVLPCGGALEVLFRVRRSRRPVPVVVLVDASDPERLPWSLFAGAVLATDDGTRLREALDAVSTGGSYVDPNLRLATTGEGSGEPERLSSRDRRIVESLTNSFARA